jgi:uncharacterized membrane protein
VFKVQYCKAVLKTFFYVLSGSILSSTVFITIFFPDSLFSILFFWEVIVMSVLTSLGTILFITKQEISKKQMKLRQIVHYIYINVIVLATALLCGWVEISAILQIGTLILLIASVYFGVGAAMIKQEEKTAESMNERLREIYPEEKDE